MYALIQASQQDVFTYVFVMLSILQSQFWTECGVSCFYLHLINLEFVRIKTTNLYRAWRSLVFSRSAAFPSSDLVSRKFLHRTVDSSRLRWCSSGCCALSRARYSLHLSLSDFFGVEAASGSGLCLCGRRLAPMVKKIKKNKERKKIAPFALLLPPPYSKWVLFLNEFNIHHEWYSSNH